MVGIGLPANSTVEAKLHVIGNDGILFQGTHGNGASLALGGGSRFHFYSKKSAVRGGNVDGIQWDDAKIGNYSVAFGKNTTASAIGSTALGENTKAEGSNSVALGRETIAKAYLSLAIGKFNVGSGVSAGTWNNNDPVFEIGDGADDANRSNILTV